MHDQSEIVFEGDSKDQVVIGSSPAGHDDDAENGGVIYGSAKYQKDDAVVGEEAEFDAVDIGATSDSEVMSVHSSSVASDQV
eukprot:scaffold110165_cov67-Cyclotella_meneghiniana.AAC.4